MNFLSKNYNLLIRLYEFVKVQQNYRHDLKGIIYNHYHHAYKN